MIRAQKPKAPKPAVSSVERREAFLRTTTPAQKAWLARAAVRPIFAFDRGEARVARSCEAKGLGKLDEMTGVFTINDAGRARVAKET
jgi:hypothetical protein